jgi:cytochrome c peroxidase
VIPYNASKRPHDLPEPIAEPVARSNPDGEKPPPEKETPHEPLPPDVAWTEPDRDAQVADVPIEFVTADREEWARLPKFWNEVAEAGKTTRIRLKVPRGIPDPTPLIPATNPPTRGKWELGRQLFFDEHVLVDGGKLACAWCHKPGPGYTAGPKQWGPVHDKDTPALFNAADHRHLFWDGRADALEQTLFRELEDERTVPPSPGGDHVWAGVIGRIRKLPAGDYQKRFSEVFGQPKATQDAVAKCLATYVRTMMSGDSVHDRAEQARKERNGNTLEPADYVKALDDDAVKALAGEGKSKDDVAKQLHQGYQLFHNVGDHKANCVLCHGGPTFTDHSFHNVGVGDTDYDPREGKAPGRIGVAPVGEKDATLIGAYRTPSLRCLPRTAPYFHDGSANDLHAAVLGHVRGGHWNWHLDPLLRDEKDPQKWRDLGLTNEEVDALVLFLKALDGGPLPPEVAEPPRLPPELPIEPDKKP